MRYSKKFGHTDSWQSNPGLRISRIVLRCSEYGNVHGSEAPYPDLHGYRCQHVCGRGRDRAINWWCICGLKTNVEMVFLDQPA